jgi:hypothetical protein
LSRFWKFVIILALVLAAMLLLTYSSPAIKEFAQGLSVSSKLPLWLVGLAAPILFVFNRLGKLLGGLFGEGQTERSIREKNEAIKAKLDEVEQNVQRLDEWRRGEVEPRIRRIDALQQSIAGMEGRATAIAESLPALERQEQEQRASRERLLRTLDELRTAIRDEAP